MSQTVQPERTTATDRATKANLGCGTDHRHGPEWINVDIRDGDAVHPDIVHDLDERPWPFETNQFERVELDNVLEHLDDQLATLRELHRVVEPGGEVVVAGPHWNSPGAWVDPTHTRPFSWRTFRHDLVREMFAVESVDVETVRWGRALPDRVALWLADHVGHGVSEVRVELTVRHAAIEHDADPLTERPYRRER